MPRDVADELIRALLQSCRATQMVSNSKKGAQQALNRWAEIFLIP
ncbi:MAG: hypothetical protein ACKOCC_03330 [Actinomycetota bacterium]